MSSNEGENQDNESNDVDPRANYAAVRDDIYKQMQEDAIGVARGKLNRDKWDTVRENGIRRNSNKSVRPRQDTPEENNDNSTNWSNSNSQDCEKIKQEISCRNQNSCIWQNETEENRKLPLEEQKGDKFKCFWKDKPVGGFRITDKYKQLNPRLYPYLWYASDCSEIHNPGHYIIEKSKNKKQLNNIYFVNNFEKMDIETDQECWFDKGCNIGSENQCVTIEGKGISSNDIIDYALYPDQNTLQKHRNKLRDTINELCFISSKDSLNSDINSAQNYLSKRSVCSGISDEVDEGANNLNRISDIIRKNTIKVFNLDADKYNIKKKPYLLIDEIQLYKETNLIEGDIPESTLNVTDINNFNIDTQTNESIMKDYNTNGKFKDCINELFISEKYNDVEMLKSLKITRLGDWTEENFNYLEDKVDQFLNIHPSEINNCINILSDIQSKVCSGKMPASINKAVLLFIDVFIDNINVYEIVKDQVDYKNYLKLIDIFKKNLKLIVKKVIELSKILEQKQCRGVTSILTDSMEDVYNIILNTDSSIKYNLFDNVKVDFSFFDDFKQSIFGKIILIIIVLFIFSKVISLFKRNKEN